jgi:TrpR family trp operon transcriptional repressor
MRTKHGIDEKVFERVAEVLAAIGSVGEMRGFLRELLTPGEVRDITLRWRLLERLAEGVTQRRIAEELKISLCKITRGSKILKQKGAVTARVLKDEAVSGLLKKKE